MSAADYQRGYAAGQRDAQAEIDRLRAEVARMKPTVDNVEAFFHREDWRLAPPTPSTPDEVNECPECGARLLTGVRRCACGWTSAPDEVDEQGTT